MKNNLLTIPAYLQPITDKAIPILKRYGVIRAGIFGSYATGEYKPESDIDLLVEMPPNASLSDLANIHAELGAALHKKIDIVTYNYIHARLRDGILKEEVPIL